MQFDYMIKHGLVVDGTGALPYRADIGVSKGRIKAVLPTGQVGSELGANVAKHIYDAAGRVVSPGFIDAHAHSERSIYKKPHAIHKISQGITTEITGHCGEAGFPSRDVCEDKGAFADLESYRRLVMAQGMGIDQVSMIGHGDLRLHAMGEGAVAATQESMDLMKELLRQQFGQGAAGMSSGLEYAPGMYSDTSEMIPLARLCRDYRRVYSTHMRSEGAELLNAAREAIEVASNSGAVTVISHLKACGKPFHGQVRQVLRMMEEANRNGARVYADCYPYPAGCTGLTIVLPQWVLEHGTEEMLRTLASDEGRQEIRRWFSKGIDVWENRSIITGWENIFVAHVDSGERKGFQGKSIREIAGMWQKDEIDTLMDLLLLERGYVPGILRSACEEDIAAAYAYPGTMVCSDSVDVEGVPHPRLYGSHTRFLSRYADLSTDEGMAEAVYRMTGLASHVYSLKGVGTIAQENRANLAVWDPGSILDKATFEDPRQLSEGIDAVFVGGQLSYRMKEVLDVRSGRFL